MRAAGNMFGGLVLVLGVAHEFLPKFPQKPGATQFSRLFWGLHLASNYSSGSFGVCFPLQIYLEAR